MRKIIIKCPNCGEFKRQIDYLRNNITNKGISGGLLVQTSTWDTNTEDAIFQCYTCGKEWKENSSHIFYDYAEIGKLNRYLENDEDE